MSLISSIKEKLLFYKVNEYILSWFAFGLGIGILLSIFTSYLISLAVVISLYGLSYLLSSFTFYIRVLLVGLLAGYCDTRIQGFFIELNRPKISYGEVKLLGYVEKVKLNDRYEVSVLSLEDANHVSHQSKGYKVNLVSQQTLEQSDHFSGIANIRPIGGINQNFATKLFFDRIIGSGQVESLTKLDPNSFFDIKRQLKKVIQSKFDKKQQDLILSVLLGQSANKELAEQCKKLGISHLLAISGLHFGIFAMVFFILGRWIIGPIIFLLFNRRFNLIFLGQIFSLFGIIYYLTITSPSWSVIRSAIMSTIPILLLFLRRRIDIQKSSIITFTFILLLWPHSLLDIGFQLSFVAVFTLIWAKGNLFTSTLKVFISTLPYLLYTFGSAAIQPFVANLVCTPIFSFLLMPLVGLGSFVQFIDPFPFIITKIADLFFLSADLCSKILVYELHHKIPSIAVLIWSVGLGSWIIISNPFILGISGILTFFLSLEKQPAQILVAHNRNDIGFYEDGILWVNNQASPSADFWINKFQPKIVLPMDEYHKDGKYLWHNIHIEMSKYKNRFVRAYTNGNPKVLSQWELVSSKKSASIVLDKDRTRVNYF